MKSSIALSLSRRGGSGSGSSRRSCSYLVNQFWEHGFNRSRRQKGRITALDALCFSAASWTEERVSAHGGDFRVSLSHADSTATPVLCLPGALGTGPSDFAPLLQGGLGKNFAVIALDPRGLHDGTRTYPRDFYRQDALDAATVMAVLGHSKYHVLGWSDGANSAIHLAAEYPTSIHRLVVWGGNAFVTAKDCEAWESLRDISNWSDRMRQEKAAILTNGNSEELQELNERATDGWIRQYTENAGDVCLQALHKVQCHTMILHGVKDVICDISHAQYMNQQIANSQLVLFAEGKHNLHLRYADTFHRIVREFLLQDYVTASNSGDGKTETDLFLSSSIDDNNDREPVIDEIAYAFMGSKALFTALRAGIFDAIDERTKQSNQGVSLESIERQSSIKGERLQTLLSACVSLNLVRRTFDSHGNELFSLPKASSDQLVRSSKRYWGDYIAGQVDAQFYARMVDLEDTMVSGSTVSSGYEAWFEADPEAARRYTQAQHNGSLATAYALHKRLPELASLPKLKMLDVGGGSGAFSIATARKIATAECVVLDLPNVTKVAEGIIAQESDDVQARLSTLSLSATTPGQWEGVVPEKSFDVVLLSYVSGSIPAVALAGLYGNAFKALKAGGRVILHDFFVDNDGQGPRNAALWALAHVTVNPEGMGLRPNRVVNLLTECGFVAPKVDNLIPGATKMIVARKPDDS